MYTVTHILTTLYPVPYAPLYCTILYLQWSVGTILLGLFSFMLEEGSTYGSIVTSDAFKRRAARESLDFNVKNK